MSRDHRRMPPYFAPLLLGLLIAPTSGQDLELVSSRRDTSGQTTADGLSGGVAISDDGRFVLFQSDAYDLVTGVSDPVFTLDLFLYDSLTKTNSLVSRSLTAPGTTANQPTVGPATISADGRWVAFESAATDLVNGTDLNLGATDVFLFDRSTGSITLVSHVPGVATTTGNGKSTNPMISRDGRYVAFESHASDLVATDGNGKKDVFLFDRVSGNLQLVSRKQGTADTTANDESFLGSISGDGAFVVFVSRALDIGNVVVDFNLERDVFLFDRAAGEVTLVSHVEGDPQETAAGFSVDPRISADGDWVVYVNEQPALIVDGISDGNGAFEEDVLLWNRQIDETLLVNRSSSSATTSGNDAALLPQISDDGRYVGFVSAATDLVTSQTDANDVLGSCCNDDIFLWDRVGGGTTLVSRSAGSATTTADRGTTFFTLSGDGRTVAFESTASNVVAGQVDVGVSSDVFLFYAASGAVELVSHALGAPQTAVGGGTALLSRHGNLAFDTGATNLGFSDSNGTFDVVALLPLIFSDGFESGSTSAWGAAAP